jgi:hypothetical protein
MSVLSVCISRRRRYISVVAIKQKVLREPERLERTLRETDWIILQKMVDAADFWALPEDEFFNRAGLDGWTWTIEGRSGERYRSLSCWMPEDGAFFDLGNLLAEFGGFALPDDAP